MRLPSKSGIHRRPLCALARCSLFLPMARLTGLSKKETFRLWAGARRRFSGHQSRLGTFLDRSLQAPCLPFGELQIPRLGRVHLFALSRSNVLRRSLHKILKDMGREKSGFHGFRRFRITHLRKQRVMEVLLRIWVGHSTHGITDNYTVESIKADADFRRQAAEETGLGFHIPVEAELPVARNAPSLHPR